ncbi:His Kinase A (phospho-acceptor) domain-containing protein [Paenibacillus sp. 1_12]|uniref:sensor histidine kinase n=1 Tax=Paenibacillus sp. 1_12 TaxID=1566278 RepID=UPI0008E15B57|nr:HAMP domain-containing sensor histidine kinase [Paenibacillus sp. 1_12]SFL37680.1 His Kinase A (phospho-acceptor) domain-containing protein [Paenibacillus sp. 1_12]
MKDKWLKWIGRRWGSDIFQRTQSRLTLVYSGLLMLFLVIFIVIVYALLYFIILNDQEREVEALVEQEVRLIEEHITTNKIMDTRLLEIQGVIGPSQDQLFNYILGPNGQMLYGNDIGRGLRPQMLDLLKGWAPKKNELRYHKLQLSKDRFGDRRFPRGYKTPLEQTNTQEIRLLTSGKAIMQGNKQIGTLYVGKNISYNYELFNWLLYIFGGLAVLFFGIALYMSHMMSKRAMIPIVQSYARQREFVADASHELRTPLSVMLSSIDSLEMEQSEETDPFVRKLLVNMKDEVKRMTKLVSNLLLLARSDTPEYILQWEAFDLQPHAEMIIESMQGLSGSKQIDLQMVASGKLDIEGDLERYKQLLIILLDNALKYTPSGGEVRLRLSLDVNDINRKLVIVVEDNGIGIADEEQEQIFHRFYRSDKSRSRQMGGHGLGLAIAKSIVEAHHGTIHVSSSLGEGTSFTVTLPITRGS